MVREAKSTFWITNPALELEKGENCMFGCRERDGNKVNICDRMQMKVVMVVIQKTHIFERWICREWSDVNRMRSEISLTFHHVRHGGCGPKGPFMLCYSML